MTKPDLNFPNPSRKDRFRGMILGGATGDALGLPAEGVSRRRARKMFQRPWRHRFILNAGMISDDTEHAVFTAQSLIAGPDDPEAFARRMARCLRWWMVSLPAGIGWATLRSILRLWIGFSPAKSGVLSAGNGPAMRAAPVGAFFADDPERLENFIRANTVITHTDPRALIGARAVAELAAWTVRESLNRRPEADAFIGVLRNCGPENAEWLEIVRTLDAACRKDLSVPDFADRMGLSKGVTGYILHTVPVAVYAFWRHFGDFETTLSAVLDCGGDTDTVGAIVGGLAGLATGGKGIPNKWIAGVWDWPRSVSTLRRIADHLESASREGSPGKPVFYFWPGVIPRNLFFLCVVLAHGFRRLFPPY